MLKPPRKRVLTSPHDALFRWTFSQREHAVGLLKAALPMAVVKAVRWSTLRVEPGSFGLSAISQGSSACRRSCRS